MGLQYRKAKVRLTYREEKPEVYKLRQLTYPQVSTNQLVSEISINTGTTKAVIDALTNRLVHYMEIGHGVKMGDFGSFKPTFNSKTVKALADLDDEEALKTVKIKKIQFYPGKQLHQMIQNISLTEASEFSIQPQS